MLPPQDRLPILQLAGQTGTVLERMDAKGQARPLPISRDEMRVTLCLSLEMPMSTIPVSLLPF